MKTTKMAVLSMAFVMMGMATTLATPVEPIQIPPPGPIEESAVQAVANMSESQQMAVMQYLETKAAAGDIAGNLAFKRVNFSKCTDASVKEAGGGRGWLHPVHETAYALIGPAFGKLHLSGVAIGDIVVALMPLLHKTSSTFGPQAFCWLAAGINDTIQNEGGKKLKWPKEQIKE